MKNEWKYMHQNKEVKMNRVIKISCIIVMVIASLSMTACLKKQDEEPKLVLADCIADSGFERSVKGEKMLYYYATPNEIALYYCSGWKSGRISCRKYFLDKDTYELEKSLADVYRFKDEKLTFLVKEYKVVEDMDAYWDEIEASSIYTIVK